MTLIYRAAGFLFLGLGIIGAFLPLMPTVVFLIAAAACFARSNPAWEQRLLDHGVVGPHIRAWRERGAVSRRGKIAATLAFLASAAMGALLLDHPWWLIPSAVAVIGIGWITTRPDA